MKMLFALFLSFAKVGIMTFGGGLAMLPMLQREIVQKRQWTTDAELVNFFALGQCTPGIIAVNTATFVGYKQKGISGGIIATLGVVFPSVVIISVFAAVIRNYSDSEIVNYAFAGIRACVSVLIISTVIKIWKSTIVDKTAIIIFASVLLLFFLTNISAVVIVIASGIAGIIISNIRKEVSK